jgi:hypothetical protein
MNGAINWAMHTVISIIAGDPALVFSMRIHCETEGPLSVKPLRLIIPLSPMTCAAGNN